ncbi:MAG TPA: arsenic resistance N-acetyltransferase ArsN2 [Gemmatimonadaceae bacterium]|jgi:amino-acid N-acetyltransferase|nr:arsenic resistance N-acetyltransferase ArsN2 [Gemmatimonadaceae bacterium]
MVQTSSTTIRSAAGSDLPAIERLLEANKLPLVGVRDAIGDFLVAERGGTLVGVIGLEIYDDRGLLRSAAVDAGERGTGVGAALVGALIETSRARGLKELVLLTTTADRWFPRFGFATIARDDTPIAVRRSAEFMGACPASASVMRLELVPAALPGAAR